MKRVLGITVSIALWTLIAACTTKGGPVKVDSVEPPQGTTAGGDEISIVGSGFQPGKTQAEVKFGRHKSESVTIASTGKIRVVTPPNEKYGAIGTLPAPSLSGDVFTTSDGGVAFASSHGGEHDEACPRHHGFYCTLDSDRGVLDQGRTGQGRFGRAATGNDSGRRRNLDRGQRVSAR